MENLTHEQIKLYNEIWKAQNQTENLIVIGFIFIIIILVWIAIRVYKIEQRTKK